MEKCKNCSGLGYIYPRPCVAGMEGYQTCPVCDGNKCTVEVQER